MSDLPLQNALAQSNVGQEIASQVHDISGENDYLGNQCSNNDNVAVFKDIEEIHISNPNNVIIGHLKINSLNSKFGEIQELIESCKLDILVLSETKQYASYKRVLQCEARQKIQ